MQFGINLALGFRFYEVQPIKLLVYLIFLFFKNQTLSFIKKTPDFVSNEVRIIEYSQH